MTHDDLARFRSGQPDCELAALVDVAAGTVLTADMAIRLGQEHLDALCAEARRLLAPPRRLATDRAMVAGPLGTRMFLRAPDGTEEVLCCLFGSGANIAEAAAAAADLWQAEHGT